MTHSNTYNRPLNRSQLEALWQQPTADHKILDRSISESNRTSTSSTAATLRQLAKDFLAFFTGSQQLRVWTKSTKQGVAWFAYDPASDQRIAHCSEEELRVWLEMRHQR